MHFSISIKEIFPSWYSALLTGNLSFPYFRGSFRVLLVVTLLGNLNNKSKKYGIADPWYSTGTWQDPTFCLDWQNRKVARMRMARVTKRFHFLFIIFNRLVITFLFWQVSSQKTNHNTWCFSENIENRKFWSVGISHRLLKWNWNFMFEIKKYLSSGLMFMHLPIPCLFNANSTFLYSLRAILVVA